MTPGDEEELQEAKAQMLRQAAGSWCLSTGGMGRLSKLVDKDIWAVKLSLA